MHFGTRSLLLYVAALSSLVCEGQQRLPGRGEYQEGSNRPGVHVATVADSIQMTTVEEGPLFSPDGERFILVVKRGNLEENTNEYSLLLWSVIDLHHSRRPDVLVTMSSSSNRPGISSVTWMHDATTIHFLGENPHEVQQLYSMDTRTHSLKKLTDHETSLMSYCFDSTGGRFAYIAEAPLETLVDDEVRRKGVVVSTQSVVLLLEGKGKQGGPFTEKQLFASVSTGIRKVPLRQKIGNGADCAMSPDGRSIVTEVNATSFPESWQWYSDPYLHEYTQKQPSDGEVSHLRRYVLIDAATGNDRTLLDSPINSESSIAWSADSKSIALGGVYLPLLQADSDSGNKKRSHRFVVEISEKTNSLTIIADEDEVSNGFNNRVYGNVTRTTEWDAKCDKIVHTIHDWQTSTDLQLVFQRKAAGYWEKTDERSNEHKTPLIRLDQDLNTSPKLFVIDRNTGTKTLLFDLNPQFVDLQFAKVQVFQWKGSDDHVVNGDLYFPLHYVRGTRYPLVIQTHGWTPHDFWFDGAATTAYAAQALAAKDIMVLQADETMYGPDWDTMGEVNREVATFEGAIDELDRKGMIDRNRVGLIGWSRPGQFVEHALTREKYKYAAAAVADGGEACISRFLIMANISPDIVTSSKRMYGGLPFGDHLKPWLDCPEFHLDRMQTPLRLLATGPMMLLIQWSWFTSLYTLGKPVEMVYLPEGDHVLQKPWERLVSQQGNVDWFAFWLKGEEDSDPAKAQQYARWRILRNHNRSSARAAAD